MAVNPIDPNPSVEPRTKRPVGLQAFQTANDLNAISGGITRDLNVVLERVQKFQQFLLTTDLKIEPYNLLQEEEDIIKSTFADLDHLRALYMGEADAGAKPPTYDYRVFAKQLYGFGTA